MTSIETEQQKIFQHIQSTSSEPYLVEKLGKPEIPVLFTRLLYYMLRSNVVPSDRAFIYCVATAYLKMGLTVHERVSSDKKKVPSQVRERQLIILAGDYYSSLFYRCMTQHEEIVGMNCLASAAVLIFEESMKQYISSTGFDELEREQWIVSQLLTAIADFFHVQEQEIWQRIFALFVALDYEKHPTDPLKRESLHARLTEEIEKIPSAEIRQAVRALQQESLPEMS